MLLGLLEYLRPGSNAELHMSLIGSCEVRREIWSLNIIPSSNIIIARAIIKIVVITFEHKFL